MRHVVAPVKNIRLLLDASISLTTRAPGVPGIGLVWGATGYGKTTAASWMLNQRKGIYVRANATWTPSAMLGAILRELSASARGSCSAMLDMTVAELIKQGRPLFVDEADYLASNKRLLETLRDIHDVSTTPVFLIGMADFRRRIQSREQLVGRISAWVEFQPTDLEDARVLADTICDVKVADDLVAQLHRSTNGSLRGMTVGLSRIERMALRRELEVVTAKEWGNAPFTLDQYGSKSEAVN